MKHSRSKPSLNLLAYTLLLAAAVHGIALLSIGFIPELPVPKDQARQNLRVVLTPPKKEPPKIVEKPEFFSQENNLGSGQSETSVLPALAPAEPQPAAIEPAPEPPLPVKQEKPAMPAQPPAAPPKTQPEKVVEAVRKTKKTPSLAPKPIPKPKLEPQPKRRITAAQLLASRRDEIARLTSEIDRKSEAYAKRPRRKAISASTRESKYAAYLESWRRKVERIGNLNYPDEARRKKLFGNLVLHVAVNADGNVQRIRVLHSSGHKVLDDAAIRIVKLSSPFAPFPPSILKEADVLDITRTWQFLNNNRLGWK